MLDSGQAVEELRREMTASAEKRYCTRVVAVFLVAQGQSTAEVGRWLGFSTRAIQKWVARYKQRGLAGLKEGRRPGRPPKLTPVHMSRIQETLEDPPFRERIMSLYWTGRVLQQHIEQRYRITLSVRQCQRILRKLGYEKDPLLLELYRADMARYWARRARPGTPLSHAAPLWFKWRRTPGWLRRKQLEARRRLRRRGFSW